jgi:putative aldouronate transport system substrate-binding protein
MMPLPIVFDNSITPHWRDVPLPNLQRGFGISVKAKDPVRIIKLMDTPLSEDWQKILQWGIKGEDYTLTAKGEPIRTPEQRKQQDDPTWKLHNKAELWFSDAPKLEGHFAGDKMACVLADNPIEYWAGQVKPEDQEILKAYGVTSYADLMDRNPPPNPPWYPAWQITPPDGSPAQLAWQKADEAFRKYLPKVILAKPEDFEKSWNEYLAALDKTNLKFYTDFVQAGINSRIAQFGPKK